MIASETWSAGERRGYRTGTRCSLVPLGASARSLTYEDRLRLEIPDEIEALESAHGVPHDPAGILVPRQVRDDAVSDPAHGSDLADHALHPGGVDVHDSDLRALACEAQGAGTSHP